MAPVLFVYGTLMPGHLRWSVLAPHARGQRRGAVAGHLYDTGRGWPAATFSGTSGTVGGVGRVTPDATVRGWLVDLHGPTASDLLTQIDEIEGIAPTGAADEQSLRHRYRRQRIATDDGVRAWAYEAAWVASNWVAIKAWTTQSER